MAQRQTSSVREKIVAAALDRFHAVGFNACGVQEIVDTAGVPKGSFYNYFKAKELLAVEVLGIYGNGAGREILRDRGRAPLARLKDHFTFLASSAACNGFAKGCLLGTMAAEMTDETPLLRDAVAASLQDWTDAVAAAIRDGQADGTITAALDAGDLARFLISAWEGAVMRMKVARNRAALDGFFAIAFPLLTK